MLRILDSSFILCWSLELQLRRPVLAFALVRALIHVLL